MTCLGPLQDLPKTRSYGGPSMTSSGRPSLVLNLQTCVGHTMRHIVKQLCPLGQLLTRN